MKKEHNEFYSISIYIALLGMFSILLALPFNRFSFVSLGTGLIAMASMALYVRINIKYFNRNNKKILYLFLLSGFLIAALICGGSFGRRNIVAAICFLELPSFLVIAEQIRTKMAIKIILLFHYLLSWYYIFLSLSDRSHYYLNEYGVQELNELTLGYNNPNETAIYLLSTIIVLVAGISFVKEKKLGVLLGFNVAYLSYLLYNTECRTAIILCGVMFFVAVFVRSNKSIDIFVRVSFIVPIISMVFLVFYSDVLTEWDLLGSSVETGRSMIYKNIFQNLDFFKAIFGSFSEYSFSNHHNIYITVFSTSGIFTTFLFFLFLYRAMKELVMKKRARYQSVALLGASVMVMHGAMESAVFVSGSAFAMCFASIYIMAAVEEGENDESITPQLQ